MSCRRLVISFLLLVLLLSPRAYAYIDPGTGSMLVQILIGSILGGVFWFRDRIKKIIGRIFMGNKKTNEPDHHR